MSKSEKALTSLAALAVLGVATIVVLNWLESSPNCNKGCRTQLEHLKDHVLEDLLQAGIRQVGLLFG